MEKITKPFASADETFQFLADCIEDCREGVIALTVVVAGLLRTLDASGAADGAEMREIMKADVRELCEKGELSSGAAEIVLSILEDQRKPAEILPFQHKRI